jgi:hypothetical protein
MKNPGRRPRAAHSLEGRLPRIALLLATMVAITACNSLDKILSVDSPSRVIPSDLEKPANANVIVNGAVADFECAFGSYILVGGMVGEELHDASLLSQWWPLDKRTFGPSGSIYATGGCSGGSGGVHVPLPTARWQAEHALALLDSWTDAEVPDRTELIATAAAFAGYSYVLLAEGMCSAAVDGGPELSRNDLAQLADDRFTRAIAAAQQAGIDSIYHLALVGRARARLDMGKKTEAAADAALVPDGFVWNATFGSEAPIRENQIFVRNRRSQVVTVDTFYREMAFQGTPDPRVTIEYDPSRKASDGELPLYYESKYLGADAPIPLARSAEARLITAEVEGGQTAVDIINDLHDDAGLPHFSSSDPAEILAQIVYERRAEFFLESHHLGDLIRYQLPLRPAAGEPFQAQKGGVYGSQLCFPLPDVERLNNPNIPDA